MCVDYTDLNTACPTNAFPFPSVDKLVDNSSNFSTLIFMDVYSGYNQIPMYPPDQEKTSFMTHKCNYCYRVIQNLTGMIATFSRFISKAANMSFPFYKLLKKGVEFEWTDECRQAIVQLKITMFIPPVLTPPAEGETLYLSMAVAEEPQSAVLIRETEEGERPVYFVSKVL